MVVEASRTSTIDQTREIMSCFVLYSFLIRFIDINDMTNFYQDYGCYLVLLGEILKFLSCKGGTEFKL